jgi:hypothetical protein
MCHGDTTHRSAESPGTDPVHAHADSCDCPCSEARTYLRISGRSRSQSRRRAGKTQGAGLSCVQGQALQHRVRAFWRAGV